MRPARLAALVALLAFSSPAQAREVVYGTDLQKSVLNGVACVSPEMMSVFTTYLKNLRAYSSLVGTPVPPLVEAFNRAAGFNVCAYIEGYEVILVGPTFYTSANGETIYHLRLLLRSGPSWRDLEVLNIFTTLSDSDDTLPTTPFSTGNNR